MSAASLSFLLLFESRIRSPLSDIYPIS
jgi:hypothetical protein